MVVTKELSGAIDLLLKAWKWRQWRRDPFRSQAKRVLEAFEAHGIAPTQIGRLSPPPPISNLADLAYPETLKNHLTPELILWVKETLQLEQGWLDGTSTKAHRLIFSYKQPRALHEWLLDQTSGEDAWPRFTMRLITSSNEGINAQSHGDFVVILEHHLRDLDDLPLTRYIYLTEGCHFNHPPCAVHLMQMLALANYHRLILRRSVLPTRLLRQLDRGQALIPVLLRKARPHKLNPDHELWPHFSGHDPWLDSLRSELDESLCAAGLTEVAEYLRTEHYGLRRPLTC